MTAPSSGRVLLRCDADASTGVGHLVRCLALAEAARSAGWTAALVGRVQGPVAEALVAAAGVEVVVGAPGAEDLLDLAVARGGDVLHLDGYGLEAPSLDRARDTGVLLSNLEDGTFGRRPADVVVDPTLDAELTDRAADGSQVLLRGLGFIPLRAAVLRARDRRRDTAAAAAVLGDRGPASRRPVVLAVMGGTDALGALPAVLELLGRVSRPSRVVAVDPRGGDAGPRHLGAHDLEVVGARPDLLELAADSDLVVTAAGTTLWELVCIGVPLALVQVADNQGHGYRRSVTSGLAAGLGTLVDVRARPADGARVVEELLSRPEAASGDGPVDGHGSERVVAAWTALLPRGRWRARAATPQDSAVLRAWRNDEVTRRWSRSTEPVTVAGHGAWLTSVLADPRRLLLVVELDGSPSATVRFDHEEGDLWEVSITVAPHARGSGAAGRSLAVATRTLATLRPDARRVVARLRPDNAASARLFYRAGYCARRELDEGAFTAHVLDMGTRAAAGSGGTGASGDPPVTSWS